MVRFLAMPNELPRGAVEAADAAVAFAQQVRRYHAKRTNKHRSAQRQQDIERAVERIREAMEPLRREIGRFQYGPQNDVAEENREIIREASLALQRERRKLWKMRPKTS